MLVEERLVSEFSLPFYDGMTAEQALQVFNDGRTVESTAVVPKQLTIAGVLGLLSQPSISKLVALPSLTDIRDKIQQGDAGGVALWGQVLVASGIITQDEGVAIAAKLTETEEKTVEQYDPPRCSQALAGVPGAPNRLDQADFQDVWTKAGRS